MLKKKKMNIGYVRVSTDEQRDKGYSIGEQIDIISKYCDKNFPEHKDFKIIDDGGFSAKNLKRLGIQQIIKLVQLDMVDKIIFISQDRLTREPIDAYYLIDLFQQHNVEVCCVFGEIDLDSADGEFMFGFKNLMNKRESMITSERTKRGLDGKARNDLYPYGKLPFGISRDNNGELYYNENIRIVEEIYDLYVNKKYSSLKVHKIIHERHKGLKMDLRYGYLTKLLKNTLYRGFFVRTTQTNEKIVANVISPIFTDEDIAKVDTIYTRYKNKSIHSYTLRNKVFFEDGRKMCHTTQFKTNSRGEKVKYVYYYIDRLYINENILINKLMKEMKSNSKKRKLVMDKKFNDLDNLFVNGDITVEQYKSMMKKLKRASNIKNQFREIVITSNKDIQVYI